MNAEEQAVLKRAVTLRIMTAERVRKMTPQERDRMMQVHLAQARGPQRNVTLLRQTAAALLRAKRTIDSQES